MTVYIDPSSDIQYASYYILGLYKLFGRKQVIFSSKYFKSFNHDNHCFAFVIVDDKKLKKIIIDFTDSSTIDKIALDWCHVYGKVNLEKSINKEAKIVAIGPSFGIQIFSLFETICMALTNLLKAYNRIPNKRKFLSDYKAQFKRPKYSQYISKPSKQNYIFFMASLWKQETKTNNLRANFISSCKSLSEIEFEGGFAPRTKNDITGFEELTTTGRIKMASYLDKTAQSAMVFNTPAVKKCHGWKLAEYLCLGKAIITTPLTRELPEKLINERHVLVTNGKLTDIKDRIHKISINNSLKEQLEINAKKYFDLHLAPKQVINKLIN